ncbi:MAG: DNA-formamidopyrimidine glycosylase family protein [Bacteriovoracaceae bacterium]
MEGPSLVILREELQKFKGKKVVSISGNSKQPITDIEGKTLKKIETWGKTIYFFFTGNIVTKTHFMLFGSYRIDEPKPDRVPRVQFDFPNGIVYFYACAFSMDAADQFEVLDHRVDVLSKDWDEKYVRTLVKKKAPSTYLCDLFLDQTLFAGSGNIVKNEVLFNLRRHPLTRLEDIKPTDIKTIVHAVRVYCEDFYEWKKKYELRKHWQVYKRWKCRNCERSLKREHIGKWKRSTFYCPHCQNKKLTSTKLVLHEVLPISGKTVKEKRLDH